MRRLATIAVLAGGTATGLLYWLHDGDLGGAVEPVLPGWGALADSLTARVEQAVAVDDPEEEPGPPPTQIAPPAVVAEERGGELSGGAEVEQP